LEPEPSNTMRFVLHSLYRLLGFALFFVALLPVWLPAVIPAQFGNAMKFIQVLCGSLLLVAATGLLVFMVVIQAPSFLLGTIAFLAGFTGALHVKGVLFPGAANAV
jgi:hypothetical protein